MATELKRKNLWRVIGWTLVLLVIYLSLTPHPVEVPLDGGDKFSHALAYLILMSWFANLYEGPSQRVGFVVGFTSLGIALEFGQAWIGYRTFEVADIVAGATGIALGWIFSPPRTHSYLRVIEKLLDI